MSETRTEADKEAKAAGVPAPEQLPTKQEVDDETAVRTGKKERFHYPAEGVSIVAKDRAEADNKLSEIVKEKENA